MCNFNILQILQMVPIGSVDFTQGCFKVCTEQKISVIPAPSPVTLLTKFSISSYLLIVVDECEDIP